MAIKKLQNNYTTPEQSKRLLELGLPTDSADCYLFKFRCEDVYTQWHIALFENKETYSWKMNLLSDGQYDYLPCWSVGRLIEIYGILRGVTCIFSLETTDIIDNIIDCFNRNKLDFSKLEE